MSKHPGYPFIPRSTAHLGAGDFWAIPLSDGRWACGRVLATDSAAEDRQDLALHGTRLFLAGLMDWVGDEPPTADGIGGSVLIDQGTAHIRTILSTGGRILGCRSLALDGISGLPRVTSPSGPKWLFIGAVRQHLATPEEIRSIPPLTVWGVAVISRRAEKYLVRGEPRVS